MIAELALSPVCPSSSIQLSRPILVHVQVMDVEEFYAVPGMVVRVDLWS